MEMGACPGVRGQCEWFSWSLQYWSDCLPQAGQSCGPGTQAREAQCVDNRGARVPSWRCDQIKRPPERRGCNLPCPRHCQVSDWTEWSTCPNSCQTGNNMLLTDG